MQEDALTIRELAKLVVDSNRPVTSFGIEMMEFSLLLRRLANSHREFAAMKRMNSPSETGTGVALDPWHASLSMEDRPRTAAFIRGSAHAIADRLAKCPGRPIHVIEAGCGPAAALSIPLMTLFSPRQLQVTIIDLHQASIDSARSLIDNLGLSDRLRAAICDDLMTHEFTEDADVIILETMDAALFREPQVALTRRLARALPDAILLPESIAVNLQLLNFSEPVFPLTIESLNRRDLGRVFELDRRSAMEVEEENGYLTASCIRIPDRVEPGDELFLVTSVRVFDNVEFAALDAEITRPIKIHNAERSWLGGALSFRYRIGETPGLEWAFQATQ